MLILILGVESLFVHSSQDLVRPEVVTITIINILQNQAPEHNFTLFGHNCGFLIMLTMEFMDILTRIC